MAFQVNTGDNRKGLDFTDKSSHIDRIDPQMIIRHL